MRITSKSATDTLNIGKAIAARASKGGIICLFGPFGSGKTVLAKGIAAGLGIKKEEVISPSFVLLRQYYKAKLPFFHFDFYRLKSEADIMALGYEEYLYDDALTVIEWAQKLDHLLPAEYLKVEFLLKGPCVRELKFSACGSRYKKLLERINENIRHRHKH